MQHRTEPTRNWKQEPLVWMLIAIPASAVVMGFCMLLLAIESDSGLVIDDYYRQGKEINRVLVRDRAAHELGLSASIEINPAGQVLVRLNAAKPIDLPDRIGLNWVHATRPGLDRNLVLNFRDGNWIAETAAFSDIGRWNLYLQTDDWRVTGSIQLPLQQSVVLLPNYFES